MNELNLLIESNAGNLAETARQLGVTYMTAWRWKTGKATPSKSMMNLIRRTLEVKEVESESVLQQK